MFNSEFQAFCGTYEQHNCDVYLGALRTENDAIKAIIFPQINIGVYQNGFAKYQAYNVTTAGVFDGRDMAAQILCSKCYLTGKNSTEADVRLFTTLMWFDSAYYTHLKTSEKRIVDYPNIWRHVRDICQLSCMFTTFGQQHIISQ